MEVFGIPILALGLPTFLSTVVVGILGVIFYEFVITPEFTSTTSPLMNTVNANINSAEQTYNANLTAATNSFQNTY